MFSRHALLLNKRLRDDPPSKKLTSAYEATKTTYSNLAPKLSLVSLVNKEGRDDRAWNQGYSCVMLPQFLLAPVIFLLFLFIFDFLNFRSGV